jgi:uncharacterized protein (DUF934 family)
MPLIRDGQIIEDVWTAVGDDAPLPSEGDVVLAFERFEAERDALKARNGRTGVRLENSVDPDEIAGALHEIDLVALVFPAFTDGRAYSQARHLRTHLGFTGELRAVGAVFADQAAFLKRVGFDSFETSSDQPVEVWDNAANSMSVAYQRGYDGPQTTRQF